MAQFLLGHWSTRVGRSCGDVCISAKYSEEAVELEKIDQPTEGSSIGYSGEEESLALSKGTGL